MNEKLTRASERGLEEKQLCIVSPAMRRQLHMSIEGKYLCVFFFSAMLPHGMCKHLRKVPVSSLDSTQKEKVPSGVDKGISVCVCVCVCGIGVRVTGG